MILHGLGEYGSRYAAAAHAANEADCDAFALDQRGHGLSGGQRGHARTLEGIVTDVGLFRDRICDGRPQLPTFILGHSVGGLVALRYLQSAHGRGVTGGILVAPFLEVAMHTPKWKLQLGTWANRMIPSFAMDNGIRLEDQFRLPEERRETQRDSLTHRRISARMWSELLRGSNLAREAIGAVDCPLLFQIPGDDRILSSASSLRLAERLGGLADVRVYGGAYHDLYRDPSRDQALGDLTQWLQGKTDGVAAKTQQTTWSE